MNFEKPLQFVNAEEYDYIVSFGNKCPTTMFLREFGIYKEAFPFDYLPTSPTLILKYLKDQTDFYPQKNVNVTRDGVKFSHFNINEKYAETIETFQRRFARLFEILESKKKILFVYTSEADVYNQLGNRYCDNYGILCEIKDYLETTYKHNNFTIVAIHTNKSYDDTVNIKNYTINVDAKYLSDDESTHVAPVYDLYRATLKSFMRQIFRSK